MRRLSVIGGVWLLVLVVISSNAGTNIIHFYIFLFGGLALAIAWVVGYAAAARRSLESPRPARRQVVLVPVFLAAAVVLAAMDGPRNPLFLARFRLSEQALTREAQRVLQSPDLARVRPGTVGLFRVRRRDVIDGQVRFITTSCGVIDSCGVVYSPTTPPKRWQEDVFTPIGGRWWHLLEGF